MSRVKTLLKWIQVWIEVWIGQPAPQFRRRAPAAQYKCSSLSNTEEYAGSTDFMFRVDTFIQCIMMMLRDSESNLLT